MNSIPKLKSTSEELAQWHRKTKISFAVFIIFLLFGIFITSLFSSSQQSALLNYSSLTMLIAFIHSYFCAKLYKAVNFDNPKAWNHWIVYVLAFILHFYFYSIGGIVMTSYLLSKAKKELKTICNN